MPRQRSPSFLAASPDGKVLYAAACVFSLAAEAAKRQLDNPESVAQVSAFSERGAQLLADVVGICFHDLQYPEHNRMAICARMQGRAPL